MVYTVKNVSEMLNISIHTLRYYDDIGLFPFVERNENNVRLFTDKDLEWVFVVHSLRSSGLPIKQVKQYIDWCLEGDTTLKQRQQMIIHQKNIMEEKLDELKEQLLILEWKEDYYNAVLSGRMPDLKNPFKYSQPNETHDHRLDRYLKEHNKKTTMSDKIPAILQDVDNLIQTSTS